MLFCSMLTKCLFSHSLPPTGLDVPYDKRTSILEKCFKKIKISLALDRY